jgi:mannose-1-phosphate guanylyltransferase
VITPVIISGGSGSRLWPLSRKHYPKQFLSLNNDRTMLQETLSRLDGLDYQPPIIVCNENHRFIVAEQLRELDIFESKIILEPFGRNTAPAIALSAFQAIKQNEDPVLLVLPADHVIKDKNAFFQAITNAEALAEQDRLVTFGIVPDKPETGFGYIKKGHLIDSVGYNVDAFFEKPDITTAESYLLSGNYYWNSGMFMFKASRYLEELKKFCPDIYHNCKLVIENIDESFDYLRLKAEVFDKCPSESIDYAVMEKTKDAAVVPLDASWNDVGSWSALWDINSKDKQGNVVIGDVIIHDVNDSYFYAGSKLVTAIGVDNLVIVETPDAVMVSSKYRVQDVKEIVEHLNSKKRSEAIFNRQVSRPWGSYDCIDTGERFKVKRIIVKPGASLSLQLHHHRAEHWVVVKGTAKVTKGDEVFVLSEDQSTYIPVGVKHRLENVTDELLEIIEVQSGSHLTEDDIVRFDDTYGRI